MLASIQIAGRSLCAPVSWFVTVHSQMSRSSCDRPMLSSRSRFGCDDAHPWRISVSSGNLTKRSKGAPFTAAQPTVARMSEDVHRQIGVDRFNATWDLIDKGDRTADEDVELLLSAMTSRWHWGQVGGPEEISTGDWQ